uniref:TetR/AcrR family transcriptional regulator n=1 Tax=Mycolicibacterium novocastrense TaxID=59813 RepID=UPI0027E2BDAA|nr:TetR family transcriptional regulator [Mycolicibacterium novocastrense]
MLETARSVFAEVGYERATIRTIAATAGVDKSSIIKYFGTKQDLFHEAVYWEIPAADLTTEDAAGTVENYARAMLTAWAADPNSPMAVLLRTSMTSEAAADILRKHITAQAIDTLSATVDAPDARLRTALVGAVLMGIASQRFILHMPDLVDADIEDILKLIAPMLKSLITP